MMSLADSQTRERHAAALCCILGDKAVLIEDASKAPYEHGARYDAGSAAIVLRPVDSHETSLALAYCVAHGLCVVLQSGNTGLVSASTPDGAGTQVVLSLERITEPFVLDEENRSVRVGSGMRLSELNRRLAPYGLFFPIDLSADPCIGGMLATNTGGARFLKYGDVRRNVLGLTTVLADEAGTILQLGRGLRKDNTGPDWRQLFIGSSGSFGAITECWLNVERMPRQAETVILVPATSQAVAGLLLRFEAELGGYLTAFEGMSRNAMAAAFGHTPHLRNPFAHGTVPEYAILAEFTRCWEPKEDEASLRNLVENTLVRMWDDGSDLLADALFGSGDDLWALRHALSEGVQKSGKLFAFDLSFPRGQVARFRDCIAEACSTSYPEVTICDFGHVGDGGVHLNMVVPRDHPELQRHSYERELRDWVVEIAVSLFKGSFSAEHGVGRTNQRYYDAYTPEQLKRLAGGFRAATSPNGLGAVRFD
ncbi:FAD-binding oxidoreductase [Mesorhizobium sp. ANAO-SY3R2]|uniref:FAD-binding oxidoreductase n=1 Tax=Mesorhizobium sp. ANAO-SY3R2 TaxID=3166644 RepID=UPI00367180D0